MSVSNLENQTFQFTLIGLSDLTYSRIPLVLFILIFYLVTVAGNLLIFVLVVMDSHLQTPMYFFLGNLSVIDIVIPSLPASHLPFDIFPGKKCISISNCIVEVFFYIWCGCTEIFMLAVMAYDRYVAICHPLRYTTMISIHLCIWLAVIAWVFGFLYSLMHSIPLLRLSYCGLVTIQGLFCELYQMIDLSCSDTYLNSLIANVTEIYTVITITITILSYVFIFKTIMKIKMEEGRMTALSTCASHLAVFSTFYITNILNYLLPKTVISSRVLSVMYTFFLSFLNPFIYSLRNKEVKHALQRTLARVGFRSMLQRTILNVSKL